MLGLVPPARKTPPNVRRKEIASTTLDAIKAGHYMHGSTKYELSEAVTASCEHTKYYEPDSELKNWQTEKPNTESYIATEVSVLEITTLQSARLLWDEREQLGIGKIGILNFASAKHEGGGFLTGAQAQEESIARASTLYPSLMTVEGQQYYKLHRKYCTGKQSRWTLFGRILLPCHDIHSGCPCH